MFRPTNVVKGTAQREIGDALIWTGERMLVVSVKSRDPARKGLDAEARARALRDLWPADSAAQPLLALLGSVARDPALRATSSAVLSLAPTEPVTADDLANALVDRYPRNYSSAVAHKVGRNAGSSWTQSGHLVGCTGNTRARAECRPPAVAYALLLGHLDGAAGEALFDTLWARVLDAPIGVLHEQAFAASQRGWIEFRHGVVTDVGFALLTRELAQKASRHLPINQLGWYIWTCL